MRDYKQNIGFFEKWGGGETLGLAIMGVGFAMLWLGRGPFYRIAGAVLLFGGLGVFLIMGAGIAKEKHIREEIRQKSEGVFIELKGDSHFFRRVPENPKEFVLEGFTYDEGVCLKAFRNGDICSTIVFAHANERTDIIQSIKDKYSVAVDTISKEYRLVGAAIATAASQFVGGFVPLVYFFRKNTSLFRLGKTRLDFRALVKACINGSSEFMSNVSMSIVGMLYNVQLLKYAGEDGIAAYGVMMYVSFIFAAVFIGYSIGTAPVISYHNGAGNHKELKGILKKSLILLTFGSVLMLVAAELLARPLALIFVSYSESLMEMTVYGFRIFAFSFLFMGFAIFGSGFFTALNDGLTSALISFLRSLVFQIGAVLLLPMIWELDGVWISVVVADLMAVILSFIFMAVKRKKYHY